MRARQLKGFWCWQDTKGATEVRFVGRGPGTTPETALAAVAPSVHRLAWLRQIHSAKAVSAAVGDCGEGDALITREPGLALTVATADCVPVVLSGGGSLAAIHAGWRGLADSIIAKTLTRMTVEPAHLTAWIGPAIGPCCYEVGSEVAQLVARASNPTVILPGPGSKPHLDLQAAALIQLSSSGVTDIRSVEGCCHCDEERLWSHRRDGKRAGRNRAFAWLRAQLS
ncbi:MAG: peptidoglycan editing factor PgeF [Thermoanaerobaculia bacterium]